MKIILISIVALIIISCGENSKQTNTTDATIDINYLTNINAINKDGSINAIIEIPSGSVDKWEVNKKNGQLEWKIKDGILRKVNYLGYPGNYGMIPGTLLPKELGGDGDPLDIIILGESVKRGTIIECKIIGALKLLDNNEQDDKLIGVMKNSPFFNLESISDLDSSYKGITLIIETFFSNYKGPNKMKSLGYIEVNEAIKILDFSIEAYNKK
ncbi:MAG: inorganic diphosphatase [Vicingaceae bacterium]|nr:inorganic diphosphatase [Vicingaceae bacterium]